jgi:hypothetical protein
VARSLSFQVLRNQSIQAIGFAEWAEDFVRRLVVAAWRLACSLGRECTGVDRRAARECAVGYFFSDRHPEPVQAMSSYECAGKFVLDRSFLALYFLEKHIKQKSVTRAPAE